MSKEQKLLPGDLAMWLIIFAELLVFGIFFVAYAVVRINNVEMFNHYQLTLNRETGTLNTVLLITASYLVVRAINYLKHNNIQRCYQFIYAAVLCGGLFLLIKSLEFHDKFSQGIDLGTNTFYMFYFSLSLFHYAHVVLGLLILIAVAVKTQRGHYHANDLNGIETAGAYWHMVDLAWIILFPLIYIMR